MAALLIRILSIELPEYMICRYICTVWTKNGISGVETIAGKSGIPYHTAYTVSTCCPQETSLVYVYQSWWHNKTHSVTISYLQHKTFTCTVKHHKIRNYDFLKYLLILKQIVHNGFSEWGLFMNYFIYYQGLNLMFFCHKQNLASHKKIYWLK